MMGGTFGVPVMGGIVTLGNDGATLGGETGSCFYAIVGTCCCGWTVARLKFQLVVLTPSFEHPLCAHMVIPVTGCGGHVSVLRRGSKRHL